MYAIRSYYGHAQEVVRLVSLLGRSLVVAAEPVLDVAVGQEPLAAHAVEAFVLLEVDLARVVDLLQDLLDSYNFV